MKQTVKTSRAAGQLEKMFRELNKHYFESKLPEPIIAALVQESHQAASLPLRLPPVPFEVWVQPP